MHAGRDGLEAGKRLFPHSDEKYGFCNVVFRVERSHVIIYYVAPMKD